MYNCKDVIDSLGSDYSTYMAENINGYGGNRGISKEDISWWCGFIEENGIPDYSLADYLNASRIMNQAINIYNDPETLVDFSFLNGTSDMKYYFDFPDEEPPYTWEFILNVIYENFPVVKEVLVNPTEFFLKNVNNPKQKYKKAKQIKKILEKEKVVENTIKNNIGIVYLLKIKDKQQYKIGVSKQFKKRYNKLNTLMPFELITVNKIKSNNIFKLEKSLHEKFKDKRIKGEWFKLEPKDVEYIMSIKDDDIDEN
jgi:mRNA-degrading endonuclease YafQ of YafQ-DinJ toxin-antitoxin module